MQLFIANDTNAVPDSTIVTNNIKPAVNTGALGLSVRQGYGRIALSGAYEGVEDAAFEIGINADSGGTPRTTSPIFAGVGNGAMSAVSVDAGSPETITVELIGTGTPAQAASSTFYGVTLIARALGTGGNDIQITVSQSGIVENETTYSTLSEISSGTATMTGQEWNFGCYALNAAGELAALTPRIRFGVDPQIYRQWITYDESSVATYNFDPPIARTIKEQTPVISITGSYTVTVTDGVTPETYSNVVTLYDFLIKVKESSALLRVDGLVIPDRTPGGMAVDEFPLRTSGYMLPYTASREDVILKNPAVDVGSATQVFTIKCIDNSVIGSELWSVSGSVDGALPDATTGVPYNQGNLAFTIQHKTAQSADDSEGDPNTWIFEQGYSSSLDKLPREQDLPAKIELTSIQYMQREVDDITGEIPNSPLLCVEAHVGSAATDKSITLVYTNKDTQPIPGAACSNLQLTGGISPYTLGALPDYWGKETPSVYWQQRSDQYYWTVNDQEYLPAFTGYHYISSKHSITHGTIYSTKEFSVGINTVPGSDASLLMEGDTINLQITVEQTADAVAAEPTISLGDSVTISYVGAQTFQLAGGAAGDGTGGLGVLTWSVRGDQSGIHPNFTMSGASASYSQGDLHFTIARGDVEFEMADSFTFSIEASRWHWRKDDGEWSASLAIPEPGAAWGLTEGVEATFTPGKYPSYVLNDQFLFSVAQPNSPNHLRDLDEQAYRYTGAATGLTIIFADTVTPTHIALVHTLPVDAQVTIKGYDTAETSVELWTQAITYRANVLLAAINPDLDELAKVTISISSATGGAINWIYLGVPTTLTNDGEINIQRTWRTLKGSSANAAGRLLGRGSGGQIVWEDHSWLLQADLDKLTALIDYTKSRFDEPILIIPNDGYLDEAILARIDAESIQIGEWYNFQIETRTERVISLSLPFTAVLA